jgi:hypothetical protein
MPFYWNLRACGAVATFIAMNVLMPCAFAQRLSVGLTVGGYANSDFVSHYIPFPGHTPDVVRSDSGGYVVGPSVGVRLFSGLSLNGEALYKPLHFSQSATFDQNGTVIGYAPATVVTWQFPILAKYMFPGERVRPFIEAGPSLRSAGNLNASDPSHKGVTAGAGAETRWWKVAIAPRVRYTRWAKDPWSAGVLTRSDQVEFLVNFSFSLAGR